MNLLDQLRKMTVVVADTGDFETIAQYKPRDATTNPSLLLKAAQMPGYRRLLEEAIERGPDRRATTTTRRSRPASTACSSPSARRSSRSSPAASRPRSTPGSRSTPRATMEKARRLIGLYEADGIDRKRILIKIASTWEGIRAAERLEKEGIHCNMTLLFSFAQAVACAEAGVTLISPVRRPHPRLVPQEAGRQEHPAGRRSGRPLGHPDLPLFQEVRLSHRDHGRELPQHRRDHRARRLRPADDLARTAGRAAEDRGHGRAQALAREGQGPEAREAPPRREDIPLDAQRGRHGHRATGRRHPPLLRRRASSSRSTSARRCASW